MLDDPHTTRTMQAALPQPKRVPPSRRPWARLIDDLVQLSGGHAELICHDERPWASVTFSGSKHKVALEFRGLAAIEAAELFIEALPEHEFAIPGQLVADAAVTATSLTMLPQPVMEVEVGLLLLEEC